jgi:hypothetical protein
VTTFAAMKTRIVDDTLRGDLTASQLGNAINEAIELQEGERYAFNERRHRILTVTGQEYYDLGAPTLLTSAGAPVPLGETVLEIDSITNTVSNWPYPLHPRTQQWFDQYAGPTYNGQPDSYTLYGQQLRLFPLPDGGGPIGGAYPIDISCLARLGPNPLSADADTNAWMTDGASIIRAQAKILLYRDLLRDDEGMALAVQQLVAAGGNPSPTSARRKMAAQAFTGRVRAWSL